MVNLNETLFNRRVVYIHKCTDAELDALLNIFTLTLERREIHNQGQWWGTFEYGNKNLKIIGTLEKD